MCKATKPMPNPNDLSPAETIALWADKIRDLSATGLEYSENIYDKTRYEALQQLALEMFAFATGHSLEAITPLKETFFSRMSPVVAGAAAVINPEGKILLMRRSDNRLWVMPGGQMEVGESPAEAVVRETFEETGIRCRAIALSGIYDSRLWDQGRNQHVYKFTFLCEPINEQAETPSHSNETLEIGWFDENNLPLDLYNGHVKRINDAYQIWKGRGQAHFD
jgi:8-oxo-dGTP pyrophosphatase MutT (NUDIX family)